MAIAAADSPGALPDESFDRFAHLVRQTLQVPTALVSIVEDDRQVFPGAVGLPEPWQTARQTPMSHSLCQIVVADSAPLVVCDTRADERTKWSAAITDLGVLAYAGWPLRDSAGRVIGSLCAIDQQPRPWSAGELEILESLAEACTAELVLRELRRRADLAEAQATRANARANTLLALASALAETHTAADVSGALRWFGEHALGGSTARVWLASAEGDVAPEPDLREAITDRVPVLRDARGRRFDTEDPAAALSVAQLPLLVGRNMIGVLTLEWPRDFPVDGPHGLDPAVLQAVAAYTAQALQRAQLVEHRSGVAQTLQQAMLTPLPEPDHLELVAQYVTAVGDDQVGGDWYDALVEENGSTTVVIGDVAGHDMDAAALMGQLRSMLRAFVWEHPDDPPSAALSRLDTAMDQLRLHTTATVFVARIDRGAGEGERVLRWSSAGHPYPVVITPDGRAELLHADVELDTGRATPPDLLLGVLPGTKRHDHLTTVPPGTTLVLYTDGLVERRDTGVDAGIDALVDAATVHHALEPTALLARLTADLVGDAPDDDVATLAVRFHPGDRSGASEQ